jgi:SH3-like domain-containing protein
MEGESAFHYNGIRRVVGTSFLGIMGSIRGRLRAAFIVIALLAAAPPAKASEQDGPGLPLPRFVTLRAGEVNMRAGPGVQYPVEWVYKRQNLPVEVIAEYRTWRKVRDWQGSQGWVHQSMLASRRAVIVTGATRTLREKPDAKSAAVAELEAGVIATLAECPQGVGWCRVEVDGFEGWLRRVDFWGTLKDEVTDQKRPGRVGR